MEGHREFFLPLAILLLLLAGLYLYLTAQHSQPLPMAVHLEQSIGIDAPPDIYEDAIAYARIFGSPNLS